MGGASVWPVPVGEGCGLVLVGEGDVLVGLGDGLDGPVPDTDGCGVVSRVVVGCSDGLGAALELVGRVTGVAGVVLWSGAGTSGVGPPPDAAVDPVAEVLLPAGVAATGVVAGPGCCWVAAGAEADGASRCAHTAPMPSPTTEAVLRLTIQTLTVGGGSIGVSSDVGAATGEGPR
ncbi:MAG: hypothetical protein ACTHJ6_14335 [Oryzihumus sp.]